MLICVNYIWKKKINVILIYVLYFGFVKLYSIGLETEKAMRFNLVKKITFYFILITIKYVLGLSKITNVILFFIFFKKIMKKISENIFLLSSMFLFYFYNSYINF